MLGQPHRSGAIDLVPDHLKSRFTALMALPISEPCLPWRKAVCASVGGLKAIGYADNSDLLLVTSSQGRGVFDGRSGQRLARDDNPSFSEDMGNCQAEGIGPLAGKMIRMAGLAGGGLATWSDGWSLEVLPLSWPDEKILLFPKLKSLWDDRHALDGVAKIEVDVMRAFGFSPTGKSFAVASSSYVMIYALAEAET
ncbi:hypothetical protein [Asticcacaulis solisilvae]|uniref:hypothetical protein n=1 Tax=Asticcacaulis solisilvae TaxID=1217274 RepID=UPI003FD73EBF